MTIVALALVAVLAVTVVAFVGLLRSERRAHARERDLLLNQLLHAIGKPWQPAPADEKPPPTDPNGDHERYQALPEQYAA